MSHYSNAHIPLTLILRIRMLPDYVQNFCKISVQLKAMTCDGINLKVNFMSNFAPYASGNGYKFK